MKKPASWGGFRSPDVRDQPTIVGMGVIIETMRAVMMFTALMLVPGAAVVKTAHGTYRSQYC
ncbi:hypothetical protein GCM10009552_08000 [Rothia nasimurium]|uniref:Uncharacterized protein n=1 Tax=Luteibacter anthropi TaxID=564369 RepID=A0A7X5U7P6_9GAMM|nr:hypothetical protein [Luteibacter anthropi]NII05386.1 hypothetical protein [Luteibacter anthropi]